MAAYTIEDIKRLREETGAGMMDVKNALNEAEGSLEKAREILRQKGAATAEKKSNRVAAEGTIQSCILKDGAVGALVEVNCETDFSARNDRFLALVDVVSRQVAEKAPANLAELKSQPSIDDSSVTIETVVTDTVGAVKENMTIRRFVRYEAPETGLVHAYIHGGGKIGVLVELTFGNPATRTQAETVQLAKDLSMHVAASAPEFVNRDQVPSEVIERETRIEMGKEDIQNKPENIRGKIVEGRVNKLIGTMVLVEQPFVKDPSKTVDELVKEVSAKVGDTITIKQFTRYLLGEGVESEESAEAQPVGAGA